MKAQGNQLTKLKVKEIVLTHAIEGDEPWPEEEVQSFENEETDNPGNTEEEGGAPTMEWDLTKKEDESDDENDQMTLF
jgi:topoisomerase-4 subunit A